MYYTGPGSFASLETQTVVYLAWLTPPLLLQLDSASNGPYVSSSDFFYI